MKRNLIPILILGAALAGCVTPRGGEWQPEFVGRTIQVEAANGQVTNLSFAPDGGVVARFNGRETQGRWTFDDGNLCFTWGASFRECWPHTRPFRPGRTESVRSDRGNDVRVTLLR